MKVVHVLNHFLPQQAAGTEVYTWALSKQLQHKEVDIEIVIPHYGSQLPAAYLHDGLRVFQYPEPSVVDRSLIMGFREPDGLAGFETHLAEARPDIIHFHELAGSNGIGLPHVVTAKKTGARVLMTFHLAGNSCKTGNLFFKENDLCDGRINTAKCSACYLHGKTSPVIAPLVYHLSSLSHRLGLNTNSWQTQAATALGTAFLIDELRDRLETIVEHCDIVVVIAQWYREMLLANGVPKEKIVYVPQGLPFDIVRSSSDDREPSLPLRLIFLGRIDPLKGLHLLLEAVTAIPHDMVELDIYGQSGDKAYETKWRSRTARQTNIRWNGRLLQQDVVTTLQEYDALCLCSTFSEMSPLVIQEAFAAGIPVIASNVYGNAEQIIHNKNGLLFRFKDAASLREQLLRCTNDPGLLKTMKKNIKPPRTFQEVGNEYFHIYQSLMSLVDARDTRGLIDS